MAHPIEVRVGGRGRVAGDDATLDATVRSTCEVCGKEPDAVASVGSVFACAICLRERLDALSVSRWRLREMSGLPWGKVSG